MPSRAGMLPHIVRSSTQAFCTERASVDPADGDRDSFTVLDADELVGRVASRSYSFSNFINCSLALDCALPVNVKSRGCKLLSKSRSLTAPPCSACKGTSLQLSRAFRSGSDQEPRNALA